MKICPQCGTQHSNKVEKCPYCQSELKNESVNKLAIIIPVAVIYLLVMTFAILSLTDTICINHKWEAASCTAARVCKNCGKTDGVSLGHSWVEATCLKEKHCEMCDETVGAPLKHTLGPWHIVKIPTLISTGTEELSCSICNTVLDSRILDQKIPTISGNSFNFTGMEFVDWISDLVTIDFDSELSSDGQLNITYPITNQNGEAGALVLNCVSNSLSGNVQGIMVYFDKTSSAISLATQIASRIQPNFGKEAAAFKLLSGRSYEKGNLSMLTYNLDGMRTIVFGPTKFIKTTRFAN